ncbi:MAG: allantoate amidohydrolase [Hyphomicrobiaceae bacterium]
MTTVAELGARLMQRLDEFARHSDEPGRLTRLYLSPAHKAAVQELTAWMQAAGLATRLDAAGTVVARYEGATRGAPALLLGSHIDTIRDAGRYDGNLGVLAALGAVEEIVRTGRRLPFAIEILAFGDEEGVRFPSTLAGSKAVAGTFDPATLQGRDAAGVSVAQALAQFGCDAAAIGAEARRPGDVRAFIEVHIEQGPVLEAEGLPVGVVTAINGASRFMVGVSGEAGHAGTVPMALRRDALAAAAEMVLAVERLPAERPGLVATVGRLEASPGAVNVIPGQVRFTVDIRAPNDAMRAAAVDEMAAAFDAIAVRRHVGVTRERTYDVPATACDPAIVDGLAAAVARQGLPVRRLPSGAGHDAMALAALCPVGMVFVRCKGGISHNPAESITAEDAGLAVAVLVDFINNLGISDTGGR